MTDLPSIIKTIVGGHPGINAVNLVLQTMEIVGVVRLDNVEYEKALAELIEQGEIIEFEYINPLMDYRVKSLFFPKGTRFPNVEKLYGPQT